MKKQLLKISYVIGTKQKIFNLFKNRLILETAIVFFGTGIVGFLDFSYHFISVRILTFEDYGTFNALVSFLLFSTMAISPLAMTLTRYFTEHIAEKNCVILPIIFIKILKKLLIVAFIVFLLFLVTSSAFAGFLKTQVVYVIISGGIIALTIFSLPFPSLLRSFQKFGIYSGTAITSSFIKLIFGGFLMCLGWGILGGLLGLLIGPVIIILTALFFLLNIFRKEMEHINKMSSITVDLFPLYKYFFPAFITMLSFAILTNIDVVLVRHFFSTFDAGYYSIAQMVGKIALFLPAALVIVIFPKCIEALVNKEHSLTLLYKSLSLGGVCCCIITGLSFIFPNIILKLFTNRVNPTSSSLVGLFSLAMGFYALLWITINFSLAIHNLKFILPLLAMSILELFFIYNYHHSLTAVLNTLCFFSMISFLTIFLIVKVTNKSYS